jgi:hypothetical protein
MWVSEVNALDAAFAEYDEMALSRGKFSNGWTALREANSDENEKACYHRNDSMGVSKIEERHPLPIRHRAQYDSPGRGRAVRQSAPLWTMRSVLTKSANQRQQKERTSMRLAKTCTS